MEHAAGPILEAAFHAAPVIQTPAKPDCKHKASQPHPALVLGFKPAACTMGGGVENQLFNIKFTAKQINRMAKKSEKQHESEKLKVKKAIEKGDPESARIYAENAIRIQKQGNNYLRLASRLEAVASRLESAIKMKQVSQQMGSVVKGMDVRGTLRSNPRRGAAAVPATSGAPPRVGLSCLYPSMPAALLPARRRCSGRWTSRRSPPPASSSSRASTRRT